MPQEVTRCRGGPLNQLYVCCQNGALNHCSRPLTVCGLEVQQSQVRGTDHSHGVSLFPMTFLTNSHQLSGLRQQKGIPAQSGGQESGVRNQGADRAVLPGGSRGGSFQPLPAPGAPGNAGLPHHSLLVLGKLSLLKPVSVSQGCCNKGPHAGWLKQQNFIGL